MTEEELEQPYCAPTKVLEDDEEYEPISPPALQANEDTDEANENADGNEDSSVQEQLASNTVLDDNSTVDAHKSKVNSDTNTDKDTAHEIRDIALKGGVSEYG